ncbi:hypothetical protein GUJ93_ZPchr0009g1614 [Zizania palustris]|uniref:Uncharacterized protein n=1 Tax=Zizania palustris TaxID=103762 RepID=A0A8J5R1P9_ZIZPA|nr:hypothetical protein GUJ93_ZPchr0009g1614 [Zizania palustris]
MAKQIVLLAVLVAVAVVAVSSTTAVATKLTLHNLCQYTVWPLVTPNTGFPSISDNTARLEGGGRGLVSFQFPSSFWAGRVVARTGCVGGGNPSRCETGNAPPSTVVQLVVHSTEAGAGKDLAVYSVSLVDGFNVPAVVSPHAIGGGQCPALGCAFDLNSACPPSQRVVGTGGAVVACKATPTYFKNRCPLTRTTPSDVEPVPQSCLAPGELKVVFCAPSTVAAGAVEAELIRTVVADS